MKTNTWLGEYMANMHVQNEAVSTVSKRKDFAVEPGFIIFPPLKMLLSCKQDNLTIPVCIIVKTLPLISPLKP